MGGCAEVVFADKGDQHPGPSVGADRGWGASDRFESDSFMPNARPVGGTIVLCTLADAALGLRPLRCEEMCQAASRQRELVTGRRFAPNSSLEAHITRFQQ